MIKKFINTILLLLNAICPLVAICLCLRVRVYADLSVDEAEVLLFYAVIISGGLISWVLSTIAYRCDYWYLNHSIGTAILALIIGLIMVFLDYNAYDDAKGILIIGPTCLNALSSFSYLNKQRDKTSFGS